jgi:hypothetical protein
VVWKNTGQTTAQLVRTSIGLALAEPHWEPGFDFEENRGPHDVVGVLGPGQTITTYADIPVEFCVKAFSGAAELHYWTWCDYDDGLAKARRPAIGAPVPEWWNW